MQIQVKYVILTVVTDSNGLVYMRARYYSPDMRRFVNADIVAGEISNAVTLNRFAYANGNPVSFVDPFGLFFIMVVPDVYFDLPTTISDEEATQIAVEIGKRAVISDDTISITMIDEEEAIKHASSVLGLTKTCDIIAKYACDKFLEENNREFILSDECVSNEILEHVKAYNWAIGENGFLNLPNGIALGHILKRFVEEMRVGNVLSAFNQLDGDGVYEATKSIDMRESDIVKKSGLDYFTSQAFVFDYKNGIREEYIGTQYDPWADERK